MARHGIYSIWLGNSISLGEYVHTCYNFTISLQICYLPPKLIFFLNYTIIGLAIVNGGYYTINYIFTYIYNFVKNETVKLKLIIIITIIFK